MAKAISNLNEFAKDNNIRLIEIDYKDVLYEDIVKALKYNGVY